MQSYNLTLTIDRAVIEPGIGSDFKQPAANLLVQYPITLETSFELLVTQEESPTMLNLVCVPTEKDISIILRNCSPAVDIRNFNIGTSKLISHSNSSSVDNNMTVTLDFIRYIKDIADLAAIIT